MQMQSPQSIYISLINESQFWNKPYEITVPWLAFPTGFYLLRAQRHRAGPAPWLSQSSRHQYSLNHSQLDPVQGGDRKEKLRRTSVRRNHVLQPGRGTPTRCGKDERPQTPTLAVPMLPALDLDHTASVP